MARKMTPGERIVELQEQKGLNQAELANRIDLSASQLSRIESGKTPSISSETLIALSKEFQISTDYILGLTAVSAPKNSGVSELGLSEAAARKLLDGSVSADVLSRLMEREDFSLLLARIPHDFCDTAALGISGGNESVDCLADGWTDYGKENPD